ncbi:hypothetical protein EF879_20370 [Micromonospora sp. HM5-17]|jgi:hypothetical protein|nr:hypothetical protein EF879_20370 [Micromonospora sp. HM5-17]
MGRSVSVVVQSRGNTVSLNEVKRTIQDGNQNARSAKTILEQVDAEIAAVKELAQVTIHDSQDEDAQAGIKILEGFSREIELTNRRIDAAIEHANTYLGTIG